MTYVLQLATIYPQSKWGKTMANRNLTAKMLKQKRRGKYKLRSGAPTKVREIDGPQRFIEDDNGNTTTVKREVITVEVIRFSQQVVNHAENGKPRRRLYSEATMFLKDYHANLPLKRG